MIQAAARDFAQKAKEGVIERDTQMAYPTDLVKEMGELVYGDNDFSRFWRKWNGYLVLCTCHGRNIKD